MTHEQLVTCRNIELYLMMEILVATTPERSLACLEALLLIHCVKHGLPHGHER